MLLVLGFRVWNRQWTEPRSSCRADMCSHPQLPQRRRYQVSDQEESDAKDDTIISSVHMLKESKHIQDAVDQRLKKHTTRMKKVRSSHKGGGGGGLMGRFLFKSHGPTTIFCQVLPRIGYPMIVLVFSYYVACAT